MRFINERLIELLEKHRKQNIKRDYKLVPHARATCKYNNELVLARHPILSDSYYSGDGCELSRSSSERSPKTCNLSSSDVMPSQRIVS